MIKIRTAKINDLESILAIDHLAHVDPKRKEFIVESIKNNRMLIAVASDLPIGFAIYSRSFFQRDFIDLIITHPDYRCQGVARTLIEHIEDICQGEKLFTSTNESNRIMHIVCERLGFTRTGYIDNLDEGDPEIIYFKKLKKN